MRVQAKAVIILPDMKAIQPVSKSARRRASPGGLSASQPGLAHAKAEMLTSEGLKGPQRAEMLKC
jgi:hypothetical protein